VHPGRHRRHRCGLRCPGPHRGRPGRDRHVRGHRRQHRRRAGAISARVRRGIFKFANSSAGDAIAQANVGVDCYIVDDQTVALTSGPNTRSRAGKVTEIDADGGIWVEVGGVDIKGPTVANAAAAPTQAEFNALTNALRSLGIIS
jgi:hypothetical protein